MRHKLAGVFLTLAMVLPAATVHAGAGPVVTSPMVFVPPSVFSEIEGAQTASPQTASPQATDQIVRHLQAATSLCSGVDGPYRVDCLADQLASTARTMPDTGDYAAAKAAIEDAAQKLHALARANADPKAPRIAATMGEVRTSRPIIPVAPETQANVNAQADAILSEAATVLLRSADDEPDLRSDYTEIATAVGSTKVLLRST